MSAKLRLVTWNIHKGIGTDRCYRLDRIIGVLKALDADVVCLQEVDEGVKRSGHDSQVQRLADALGYTHAALGLNVRVGAGAYGSATLSRHPLWEVRNVDLTVPPKKRRGGLVTRIEHGPPGGWLLANVHLGLLHLERKVQVKRLLTHLLQDADEHEHRPVVIAGDWNEWGNRLVQGALNASGFHLARADCHGPRGARTFPSRRPLASLDRVLYRAPARLHHVACVVDDSTRCASDHLPIVVDLETPLQPHAPAHAHAST
jgi:endonuclease/exonuclease/phosphatase family metal-dependent hydrolase